MICPNCEKKLSEKFTYCYECGCNVGEGVLGDFKTPHMNVFKDNEEFIYIFSVNGKQVVLRAGSIDELKMLVRLNKFPWEDLQIED